MSLNAGSRSVTRLSVQNADHHAVVVAWQTSQHETQYFHVDMRVRRPENKRESLVYPLAARRKCAKHRAIMASESVVTTVSIRLRSA